VGQRDRGDDRDGRLIWELASAPPGSHERPDGLDGLEFHPAIVPGTVAAALGPEVELDGSDWWFRTTFTAEEAGEVLVLDGLATICDVFLNGERVARCESMFEAVRVPLTGRLRGRNQLAVCCRALAPLLAERRRPRARWRTALVADGNLRFFRTMLLGRAPGFAPGPPVVGIWRPVRFEPAPALSDLRLRASVDGDGAGVVRADFHVRASVARLRLRLSGPTGVHDGKLGPEGGEVRIPSVARWWPHTHGDPALYDAEILDGEHVLERARVGFRTLEWPADWVQRGLALRINGVEVFCRGALWTPPSLEHPHAGADALRATLRRVRDAGMNMLRIPGIACYESDDFLDLCDELGLLLWQDFMFANLDYPDADPAFMTVVEREARDQLGRLARRPSLTVVCGGSECAQQVTMLGLDPELARGPLYTELLPRLVEEAGAEVPYLPNAPWGATLPFRPGDGVANYYGVGAYRRPLTDARLAAVPFAAECLAFSNVPDEAALADLPGLASGAAPVPHLPAWRAGIPRDAGAGWDFEDVRDHYLRELYGVDPVEVRWTDPERYLELGRAVTGEVMAETFGEWRRAGSPCAGALILWLRDLRPGAGWGVLDHTGRPKAAMHHLRRSLAPVAVWITDEGLAGMMIHVANDACEALAATLRVALYRDGEVLVEQAAVRVAIDPHGTAAYDSETVIGHFVDIGWAYRFGPPAQDLVVASLETGPGPGEGVLSKAFRFPVGRPLRRETAVALGLEAAVAPGAAPAGDARAAGDAAAPGDAGARLTLRARRVVHGLRIDAPGWVPADDALTLEPGVEHEISLRRDGPGADGANADAPPPRVTITALNLTDRVRAQ
jgi:beta-mannosidase